MPPFRPTGRGVVAVVAALMSLAAMLLVPGAARHGDDPGGALTASPCDGTGRVGTRPLSGLARDVWAYVPRGANGPDRRAVVVLLHGGRLNGLDMIDPGYGTQFQRTADRHGFVIVVPNGGITVAGDRATGSRHSWIVPGSEGGGGGDVAFLSRLLTDLPRRLCVDRSRTFMTGFSAGARMTSEFACRHRDQVAAIAPVSGLRAGAPVDAGGGTYRPGSCPGLGPGRPPLPVIAFHGGVDTLNPLTGDPPRRGSDRWGYSVPIALARWAAIDRCVTRPDERVLPISPAVRVVTYGGCAGGVAVKLYEIAGAGHAWPASPDLDTNERIWEQFARAPARP